MHFQILFMWFSYVCGHLYHRTTWLELVLFPPMGHRAGRQAPLPTASSCHHRNTWLPESSEPFKQPCQLLRQPQLMETIMQISTLSTIFASWSEGAPPPQVWQVTHRQSPDQTRSRCSLWLMGEGSFQAKLPPIHQTHPSYLILTPQGLISDLWFS